MFATSDERKWGPKTETIKPITLPPITTGTLDNGIPYYLINLGQQPVCKIEIVFKAGRPFERVPVTARAAGSLLKEGAGGRSAESIAETLDYFGASLRTSSGLDFGAVTLYTLNKHLERLLPLVSDVIWNPDFSEDDVADYKTLQATQLKQELHKADVVAYRIITELIFGHDHPYGYNSTPEDYLNVHREDIIQHYQRCYRPGNARVFISGKIDPGTLSLINKYFGQTPKTDMSEKPLIPPKPETPQHLFIPKKKAEQNSIRMGFAFGNRSHPDYPLFYLANTILGGYFGSRLMRNIREEKGYTYNIYSQIDPHLYDGSFYISSEVSTESGSKVIDEIRTELDILRTHLVPAEELTMVKNYLLGQMHNMVDGPFNLATVVKSLIVETGSMDFFSTFSEQIANASASDIQQISEKYLYLDRMHWCGVGPVSVF